MPPAASLYFRDARVCRSRRDPSVRDNQGDRDHSNGQKFKVENRNSFTRTDRVTNQGEQGGKSAITRSCCLHWTGGSEEEGRANGAQRPTRADTRTTAGPSSGSRRKEELCGLLERLLKHRALGGNTVASPSCLPSRLPTVPPVGCREPGRHSLQESAFTQCRAEQNTCRMDLRADRPRIHTAHILCVNW